MSDIAIKTNGLTKDYGEDRGIFGIDLEIRRGEVFGYVGTNGSGKTTTIRSMMGFIKADRGSASVLGMDSWKQAPEIMRSVSYIPGEIAFPSLATGTEFLKSQAEYLGVTDYTYMNQLIEMLQLDPSANLKRMSKGMKQKTAIVAALMGEKDILVLDEPTTGLDPLMREAFLSMIREEKAKGRTIFMSSHIFEEIEDICDRVAMIRDGRIVDVANLYELRHSGTKSFAVTFRSEADARSWAGNMQFNTTARGTVCDVTFSAEKVGLFLQALKQYSILEIRENKMTLEKYFMQSYRKGGNR